MEAEVDIGSKCQWKFDSATIATKISPQQSNFQHSCWWASIMCPHFPWGGCIMNVSEVIIRRKRSTEEGYFCCKSFCLCWCGWTVTSPFTRVSVIREMLSKHRYKKKEGITVCFWFNYTNSNECGPWNCCLRRPQVLSEPFLPHINLERRSVTYMTRQCFSDVNARGRLCHNTLSSSCR